MVGVLHRHVLPSTPVLRPRSPGSTRLEVLYDDAPIEACASDTVTTALLGAGIVATSRSLKFRRPRGPYCLDGDCGTCLVRIDGVPNVRACTTMVAPGMRIAPQNRVIAGGGPDPTALVDRMFSGGMDHHHFMVRPRVVNLVMQEVARNLAGLGTLPDAAPELVEPARVRELDVVVVGGGASGARAAARLHEGGLSVVALERRDRDPAGHGEHVVEHDAAVFGIYPAEGMVAAVVGRGARRSLHTFTPRHLVIATGARAPILALCNNDLPGTVSARGLARQLARSDRALAEAVVVIGAPDEAEPHARAWGCEHVAPDDVEAIVGGGRVEAIATRRGKLAAHLAVLAPPPAPASELARQAGCAVAWDGRGFPVVRDADGRAGGGPWTVWACGQVAGVPAAASADDGERIAAAILRRARGGGR